MALLKNIELSNGFVVPYWAIEGYRIQPKQYKRAEIIVGGYKSQQDKTDGKSPVEIRKYGVYDNHLHTFWTDYVSPEALEQYAAQGMTVNNVLYKFLKDNVPDFDGAEDC